MVTSIRVVIIHFLLLCIIMPGCNRSGIEKIKSKDAEFALEVVADSIQVPFGMSFLPDGRLLVTDRPTGEINLVDIRSGARKKVKGVPKALCKGDGGMLDILVHPDFEKDPWIYISFSIEKDSLSTMVVERAHLAKDSLVDRERIFTALPFYKEPNHFGSRLIIDNKYLFITMGERYFLRDSAQTLSNHLGKVMRLHDNGRIPKDNPFLHTKGALPEIWSFGHRNAQGLVVHPETGELWEHEHGPKGGDEVNILRPGVNYGWPVVCYGIDYDGKPIGEGITEKKGMEEPHYYYVPSIAPSGMEFYAGDVFPEWKGNLFLGAMALRHLNRLVIEDDKVVMEERLLKDKKWRVRNVKQGPDGFLYIGVDGGQIVRLRD